VAATRVAAVLREPVLVDGLMGAAAVLQCVDGMWFVSGGPLDGKLVKPGVLESVHPHAALLLRALLCLKGVVGAAEQRVQETRASCIDVEAALAATGQCTWLADACERICSFIRETHLSHSRTAASTPSPQSR